MMKAKLHEVGDKHKFISPKNSFAGMVYVTSETEKSDMAPLYLMAKLNSDPSLHTKTTQSRRGGNKKLPYRAYYPSKPKK
jgi:hypothetical protein